MCVPGREPARARRGARSPRSRCRRRRRRRAPPRSTRPRASASRARAPRRDRRVPAPDPDDRIVEHRLHRVDVRASLHAGAEDRDGARARSREQPRRGARHGGGADLGDRRGVEDRDQLARDAVVEQHRALVRVEAAGRVAGRDDDLLEREDRVVAAARGRASTPSRPARRADEKRSGLSARRARAARGCPPSPSTHDSMSSSPRTSCSERMRTLTRTPPSDGRGRQGRE